MGNGELEADALEQQLQIRVVSDTKGCDQDARGKRECSYVERSIRSGWLNKKRHTHVRLSTNGINKSAKIYHFADFDFSRTVILPL